MGSFNLSCGISGAPIYEGAKVKLFFIAKNDNDGLLCHSNDDWRPISFPIDATYDDYGRYEFDDDNDPNLRLLLHVLRSTCHPVKEDDSRHVGELIPKDLSIKQMWDAIHEGVLCVGNGFMHNEKDFVAQFAVLEHVYNRMLSVRLTNWRGQPLTKKFFKEDILVRFDKAWTVWEEISRHTINADNSEYTDEQVNKRIEQEKAWKFVDQLNEDRIFGYSGSSVAQEAMTIMSSLDVVLDKWTEMQLFVSVMDTCQIMWQPIMSSGQDVDYEQHIRVQSEILRGVYDTFKQYKSQWGDEWDEEDYSKSPLSDEERDFLRTPVAVE